VAAEPVAPAVNGFTLNAFISALPFLYESGISNSYQVLPLASVIVAGSLPKTFLIVFLVSLYF
jgi:hypothetical protein